MVHSVLPHAAAAQPLLWLLASRYKLQPPNHAPTSRSPSPQSMDVARKSFTATGEEDRRWQGLVLASAVAGMVQHAAGEFVSAGESVGAGARCWGGAGALLGC